MTKKEIDEARRVLKKLLEDIPDNNNYWLGEVKQYTKALTTALNCLERKECDILEYSVTRLRSPMPKPHKEVVHYFIYHNRQKLYKCNQCFTANMKKSTRNIANVTCPNCVKGIKKDRSIK